MTLDQHFAPFVGDYIQQATKLQHLVINFGDYTARGSGGATLTILPDLSDLTQLRSLKVQAVDTGTDALAHCLAKSPESLTSCYIEGVRDKHIKLSFSPEVYQPVKEHPRRLTKLELHFCSVQIPQGSITCLEGLTSLSITCSEIEPELYEVTRLTNLMYLDLTDTYAFADDYDYSEGEGEQWIRFTTWPGLRVFKFAGCWLIDSSIALDITTVHELHTNKLTPGTENANKHWILQHRHDDTSGVHISLLSPIWCGCIVELHVDDVYGRQRAARPDFAAFLQQVSEACLRLQTLHLVGRASDTPGQAKVVLGSGNLVKLKNLKLRDICCRILDFKLATCLTSISLKDIDPLDVPCELMLPSSLGCLEFFGYGLFNRRVAYILQGLSSLTQVTLGSQAPGTYSGMFLPENYSSSACMPTLPGSLRHLRVAHLFTKELLDDSAQTCLRYCSALEHLTLPANLSPQGELYAWVKAARHVHVLDNHYDSDWRYGRA